MTNMKLSMLKWIGAPAVTAMVMMSYVHGFVYTRVEGEALQSTFEEHRSEHAEDLREIRRRVDQIYLLLRNKH